MANAIQLISKRAKQLQKTNRGRQWKSLIKQASAEYRAGKLGAVKKKSSSRKKKRPIKKMKYRQTGSSNKQRNEERSAMKPGKRQGYYERRKNRSDMPGKLTGTKNEPFLGITDSSIKKELRDRMITKLGQKIVAKDKAPKIRDRRALGKEIAILRKEIKNFL